MCQRCCKRHTDVHRRSPTTTKNVLMYSCTIDSLGEQTEVCARTNVAFTTHYVCKQRAFTARLTRTGGTCIDLTKEKVCLALVFDDEAKHVVQQRKTTTQAPLVCEIVTSAAHKIVLRLRIYVLSSFYDRSRFRLQFDIGTTDRARCFSDPFFVVSKPHIAMASLKESDNDKVTRTTKTMTTERERKRKREVDNDDDDDECTRRGGLAEVTKAQQQARKVARTVNGQMFAALFGSIEQRLARIEYKQEEQQQQQQQQREQHCLSLHTTLEMALSKVVNAYHALPVGSRTSELHRALWALISPVHGNMLDDARAAVGINQATTLSALGAVSQALDHVRRSHADSDVIDVPVSSPASVPVPETTAGPLHNDEDDYDEMTHHRWLATSSSISMPDEYLTLMH